jgi:hypothetical protein
MCRKNSQEFPEVGAEKSRNTTELWLKLISFQIVHIKY